MNIREVCEKLKMLHGPSADAPYAEDDDALRFSSFCHDHVLELIEAYEQLQISSHKTWNEANELHHKLEKKEKALNLFFGRLEGLVDSALYDWEATWASKVIEEANQILEGKNESV